MSSVPTDIQAHRERGILAVLWGDQQTDLPFVFLRGQCECAACVNEWTGQRILDPRSIPKGISIEKMELVGNYAVRIHWSDGHNSGLYTWQRLQDMKPPSEPDGL